MNEQRRVLNLMNWMARLKKDIENQQRTKSNGSLITRFCFFLLYSLSSNMSSLPASSQSSLRSAAVADDSPDDDICSSSDGAMCPTKGIFTIVFDVFFSQCLACRRCRYIYIFACLHDCFLGIVRNSIRQNDESSPSDDDDDDGGMYHAKKKEKKKSEGVVYHKDLIESKLCFFPLQLRMNGFQVKSLLIDKEQHFWKNSIVRVYTKSNMLTIELKTYRNRTTNMLIE